MTFALIAALIATKALPVPQALGTMQQITGVARGATGVGAILHLRDGRNVRLDASAALRAHQEAVLVDGQAYRAVGTYARSGTFEAQLVVRAKSSPTLWIPDR